MNKKLFFILLIVYIPVAAVFGGVGPWEGMELLEIQKAEVREINSMELRRVYQGFGEWQLIYDEPINEWKHACYFDSDGYLRKSTHFYSYPEGTGYFYRYYNREGITIYATFNCQSGHDGDISTAVYRDGEGNLLWLDHMEYEGDGGPDILISSVIRYGPYFSGDLSSLPETKDAWSFFPRNTDELWENEMKRSGMDSLYSPSEYTLVKFVEPHAGQSASVYCNRVPIYKKNTASSLVLQELRMSFSFTIMKSAGDWFRIKLKKYHGGDPGRTEEIVGYIRREFVEPVEMELGVVHASAGKQDSIK